MDGPFVPGEAGNATSLLFIFPLCVLFVFLRRLSAQYESWLLPLAVILIVPWACCLRSRCLEVLGMDNNIAAQIGFICACWLWRAKRDTYRRVCQGREDSSKTIRSCTISAARLRLRPILMTSIAFILGVVLVIATGPEAKCVELSARQFSAG
ncbi:MAG: efflux RND transporter permease subunit [Pirellulaceae bacterium]